MTMSGFEMMMQKLVCTQVRHKSRNPVGDTDIPSTVHLISKGKKKKKKVEKASISSCSCLA